MKKRIFVLKKCVKIKENIISQLISICSFFIETYFLNFPSNKNVIKQHLSANAYSHVNMTFSYTIFIQLYEKMKFSVLFFNKSKQFLTSIQVSFSLTIFKQKIKFSKSFLSENKQLGNFFWTYIFLLISCTKCDRRNVIKESRISFFPFMVKCLCNVFNFLKFYFPKQHVEYNWLTLNIYIYIYI